MLRLTRLTGSLLLGLLLNHIVTLGALADHRPAETASGLYKAEGYAATSTNGAGAVASVHPLATQAGLAALQSGGNAIDAAVAVALTLGVVDSHNSGIGGGCFALIRLSSGKLIALDGREMAPARAYRDMYLRDGQADPGLSKTGALAVGVPGSLAVYEQLLKQAGTQSLAELILPAADIAEQGFALSAVTAKRLQRVADTVKDFPATAEVLLNAKGEPWPAGHIIKQADLATTYRAIAKQGSDYFYRGDFAKQVDQWMQANGGILRYQDFADYQLKEREPVISDYRGYTLVGFPPPSSGGVHVAQILNILENFELKALPEAERYHLILEAMRRAFADRAHYLGDSDFVPVPRGLISQRYADELAASISPERVGTNIEHGLPPALTEDLFGKHTTHISTADKWGNWVAITTTVNTSFGSKVIVPGTGVILNNQMDDFSIQPGVPNAFGLVGSIANQVAAGKRPLSSMSPTLVLKDDKPVMSLGAAGGPTIISQVVQALINVIDLGLNAEQALARPRVHQQWKPAFSMVEKSLTGSVTQLLKNKGHTLYTRPFMGTTQLIRSTREGFDAASEPRVITQNQ